MIKTGVVAFLALLLLALIAASSSTDPAAAARLNNIGVAYMNQQLFEKGLKSFEEAAAKDPNLRIPAINRAIALFNLQRGEEARALLEQALKTDPGDAHAWFNLGLYFKNSSAPERAVDAFRRVTEIDPDDADTWYFLGSTYAQLKKSPQAIEAFEHALKIDPLHASAQFGLSRAYQQSGDTDRARENLKKFQYITQNKLGSPISLVYGEQGKYSRAEESPQAAQKVLDEIPRKFVDVTKEAGIVTRATGATESREAVGILKPGACFVDYDNDGRVDLFLPDNGPDGGMALFHNLGNGKFEEVTAKAGLDPKAHAVLCTAGDYDNDGFADLVIAGRGISLWHNEGNGSFKNVTGASGISGAGSVFGLAFVDYDHDGDLDLLVGGDTTLWRNNGNGTFTQVTAEKGFASENTLRCSGNVLGSDVNNDRAVDLVSTCPSAPPVISLNPREGKFPVMTWTSNLPAGEQGVSVLDFDHDGWMDLAFTSPGPPSFSLWHNNRGKSFERVDLPETNWVRAFGIVAFDYDNDGWVDLAAVGETKEGKGEVRLFRNLGPDGWKDVTAEVGLDRIQLKDPRAIIAGDYDNDGAVDLLVTQNQGPAILLRNEGVNRNNSLRLALKGLNDNKSAIGAKIEVFSGGLRQKFEVYGSSGYLGQNSPYLTIGLGPAKEADVVRLIWPTGVLQDEIQVASNKVQNILEIDRRGSSCPTLFAWDGHQYRLVGDMLGAGVVGHWVGANQGVVERNIARPVEYIKIDRHRLREKGGKLSFRFMEPLEESVYLDKVDLLAVDHPADVDVYPNEYFASNPPYPQFKPVFSRDAHLPAGAWDEHGHDLLPDLVAHRYFGDFKVLSFLGFTEPHTLELDLGEPYLGGPLWLLMHGEIEYFSANSMYAADQAGLHPFAPYVEALVPARGSAQAGVSLKDARLQPCPKGCSQAAAFAAEKSAPNQKNSNGRWVRVIDDLGFPAGGARTMTADLTSKLPLGTKRIRLTTNLQIYWDNILISRTAQQQPARITHVRLAQADLSFHGFPLKIEDQPPGNVRYVYEKVSATGPYTRPSGAYTRYGDVLPLLKSTDDKLVVFGSGDEVALDFDPGSLPALPSGWLRDYFFAAMGYEKDMDFYAYRGDTVEPLPFSSMETYPYPGKLFPNDPDHLNYLLEYNTRFMSGNESGRYSFQYPTRP